LGPRHPLAEPTGAGFSPEADRGPADGIVRVLAGPRTAVLVPETVEGRPGMHDAKAGPTTVAVGVLAPLRSRRAKAWLGSARGPGGIPAPKGRWAPRLVGHINSWDFVDETRHSVVFSHPGLARVQSPGLAKG